MNNYNVHIVEQRAQARMQRRDELDAVLDHAIEEFEVWATAKFPGASKDEILNKALDAFIDDDITIPAQRAYASLEDGGCGDVEEQCKKDKANYNVETCTACQARYVVLRDFELELQKEEDIEQTLANTERSEKSVVDTISKTYESMKKEHRKVLPTLLQKANGG
jgi:hypothetical protein